MNPTVGLVGVLTLTIALCLFFKTPANNDYSVTPEIAEYTDEEMLLMARVVQAEAGNQDETGMRLVVSVILNRLDHPDFPDTIRGVVEQQNQFCIHGWASLAAEDAVYKETRERTNRNVLWFHYEHYPPYGEPLFVYGGHYFSGMGD